MTLRICIVLACSRDKSASENEVENVVGCERTRAIDPLIGVENVDLAFGMGIPEAASRKDGNDILPVGAESMKGSYSSQACCDILIGDSSALRI